MAGEGSEKITLSRETLRAELSQLELRLVDRLSAALETKADSKVVEQHDARITSLELSRAQRETMPSDLSDIDKRVMALERFRFAIPSISMLGFLVSVSLLVFYLTR